MSSIWSLIYATEEHGANVYGDIRVFRNAVLAGADVKVIYRLPSGSVWSRNLSSVTITRTGNLLVIAGTYMEAADTKPSDGYIDFERNPFAIEYQIYNSTGVRVVMKFDYRTRNPIATPHHEFVSMKWYVKDYEATPWWLTSVADFSKLQEMWPDEQ